MNRGIYMIKDAIEKYSFPTVPAGQPGSQEWQESFWKER